MVVGSSLTTAEMNETATNTARAAVPRSALISWISSCSISDVSPLQRSSSTAASKSSYVRAIVVTVDKAGLAPHTERWVRQSNSSGEKAVVDPPRPRDLVSERRGGGPAEFARTPKTFTFTPMFALALTLT